MATAKTTEDTTAELKAELKALRDDFAKLVETVKTFGTEQAESALNSAKEAAEGAAEGLKMTADEARRRGEAAAEDVEAIIKRHPLTSVLVAVGLGYIFGRIRH